MSPTGRSSSKGTGKETPAPDVSSPSPTLGSGSEYSGFIWQQLGDIQSKLGAIQQGVLNVATELQKLDTKVEASREEIHTIKSRMYAAAAVVTVLLGIFGFVFHEFWDVIKPTIVARLSADPSPPHPIPQAVDKPTPTKPQKP